MIDSYFETFSDILKSLPAPRSYRNIHIHRRLKFSSAWHVGHPTYAQERCSATPRHTERASDMKVCLSSRRYRQCGVFLSLLRQWDSDWLDYYYLQLICSSFVKPSFLWDRLKCGVFLSLFRQWDSDRLNYNYFQLFAHRLWYPLFYEIVSNLMPSWAEFSHSFNEGLPHQSNWHDYCK